MPFLSIKAWMASEESGFLLRLVCHFDPAGSGILLNTGLSQEL